MGGYVAEGGVELGGELEGVSWGKGRKQNGMRCVRLLGRGNLGVELVCRPWWMTCGKRQWTSEDSSGNRELKSAAGDVRQGYLGLALE